MVGGSCAEPPWSEPARQPPKTLLLFICENLRPSADPLFPDSCSFVKFVGTEPPTYHTNEGYP